MRKVALIPKHIQYLCLKKYVDKCRELHTIAFYQWRDVYPHPDTHDEDELQALIHSRLDRLVYYY